MYATDTRGRPARLTARPARIHEAWLSALACALPFFWSILVQAQPPPEPAHENTPPAPQQRAPDTAPVPAPGTFERPRLLRDASLRYPPAAWAEEREADVVVLITPDEFGTVTATEIVEPAGHGFDEEALRAARLLRFSPARMDGVASAVQIRYTFRFRVQKREVFKTWFFDFYIDFFNAAFQWETVGYEFDPVTGQEVPETLPLFVPMLGIRGEF